MGLPVAWLMLAAAVLALGAWPWRIFPTRRMVLVAATAAMVSLGMLGWPAVSEGLARFNVVWLIVAVIDAATCPRARYFQVRRRAGRVVSLRQSHRVALELSYSGRRRVSVHVVDDIPPAFTAVPARHAAKLVPGSRATFHYRLQASRRGAFTQEFLALQALSLLGLWRRGLQIDCRSTLQVYPDLRQLHEYALLARTNRLMLLGVRRTRRVGQDHDFERLRDYTPDDPYRHMDWRSTARRQKLTVREFQTSQSQRLVFLIDCGRMMHSHVAGLSLLDHALNACLMLSYVALRQGDAVGMMLFGDRVRMCVPPLGGQRQMNRLLRGSFDIFPQMVETRYDLAFRHLARVCRRRALVILVTQVIDAVNARILRDQLSAAQRRHVPLCVLLRDRDVYRHVESAEPEGPECYVSAAAAHILHWRQVVIHDLQQRGALTLDVFPDALTAPLINRYLEIKARHLL